MLPDIGASEYLIIAVAALIFIGPKDLPKALRTLGQWVAKARGMAADFRSSFDEMARQSELDDLRKEVEAMRKGQYDPARLAADHAGAAEIHDTFAQIESGLRDGAVSLHPPMGGNDAPPPPSGPEPSDAPILAPIAAPVLEAETEAEPIVAKPRRARKDPAIVSAPRRSRKKV
jgi:sec-independent protein translocase protein TatB